MRPHETVPASGSKVRIGDDRAIPASPNWAAMSHQQLYDAVHQGNNPGDAHGLAREWAALGAEIAESSRSLGEQVRGTESGWRGDAAEAARDAISRLVSWSETAAETSSYMAGRIADQAQIAEQAKAAMPEPVHFDPAEELANAATTGGIFGLIAAGADLKQKSDQARSAHDNAVHVMQTMESDSRRVDGDTPRFTPPPEVIRGSPTDSGPQPSTTAADGSSPILKQSKVEPRAAGTVSAGASPAAVAPMSQSPSPAAAVPGGEASYGGAAAVSGGVPLGSPSSVASAAAPGGEVRGGAPGSGTVSGASAGGGSYGDSATVKFRPVGSSAGGSPAASSSAGYTPPSAVTGSQWDKPNSSSGSRSPAADGQDKVRGPSQGWQPGMSGAGARGSGSSSGRPGSAPRNPRVSNEMRDPNYWARRLGSEADGGPSQPGTSGLAGTPGATAPEPGASGEMPDPKPGASGLPGGTRTSGAGSIGEAGAAHIPEGGISRMSGVLPLDGAPGTAPNANHSAMGGSAAAASSAGAPGAQGGAAMGPMGAGAGRQGPQEKERKSPGYITGEKIVEEPGRVPPPVIGETFKKKRFKRD